MSLKNFLSAGLLCLLASPVFAVPQLEITSGGLNANGQFIWNVRIAPNAVGDDIATELGFKQTVGNGIVKATNASTANFDYNNPGTVIFGWEKTYGSPLKPEGLQGNFTGAATGTTVVNGATLGGNAQTACLTSAANCATTGAGTNEVFSAMGSKIMAAGDLTSPGAGPTLIGNTNAHLANSTPYLTILTNGPSTATSTTSTIQLTGAYDGANKSGRIADVNGATTNNYKGFTGSASITVGTGDIDLNGHVDLTDLTALAGQYAPGVLGKNWTTGDFNGDGKTDLTDLTALAGQYNPAANVGSYSILSVTTATLDAPGSGSGLGAGSAVPEPASIALVGLALLGSLGIIRRQR